MNPLTQSKNTIILPVLIALTLGCFALSPQARAVCQDACLTNSNTVQGDDALFSLTTGIGNTAIGARALSSLTSGPDNTAIGVDALASLTVANSNTAIGARALQFNTGAQNTAIGVDALQFNTNDNNTAIGGAALGFNTTGTNNTAIGAFALQLNTTGSNNTANGREALLSNTTGSSNTVNGVFALNKNTTGSENTANGANALYTNKTGIDNTANGSGALFSNKFGSHNTADGFNALYNNRTGAFNIALGDSAGFNTTGRNNIDIGNQGIADESGTIRIGTVGTHTATYIAGIYGQVVAPATGTPVLIDGNGRLGTMLGPISSSRRFKHDIKAMDKASESILALQPVTFRYKKELDPDGIPQFGLVAEEVEKVNPDLVARDDEGKVYSVRYEAVNAMLLNEFLKEHRKVEEQQATIAQLKAADAKQEEKISALTELVKEQAAQIQKVSAQLEVNKTASQIVLNNQ
jgi:hypothetical protein